MFCLGEEGLVPNDLADFLFCGSTEEYDKAAAQCPSILGSDAELWEHWIYAFAEARQLKVRICLFETCALPISRNVLTAFVFPIVGHCWIYTVQGADA